MAGSAQSLDSGADMRSMGLDVGDRRIGVALSDSVGILATPFGIVEQADDESAVAEIVEVARREEVAVIVVGLPRMMSGRLGTQAEKVQAFADMLRRATDLPVEFRDERLSTVTAKRLVGRRRERKSRRKVRYDDAAAAVILQYYLDEVRLSQPPIFDDDASDDGEGGP